MKSRSIGFIEIIIIVTFVSCTNKTSNTGDIKASTNRPNIIVLFTDDQGYADVGAFGSEIPTPSLDKMVSEGMKLTDFYVPVPSCAPSRNALLTGCYPSRNYVSVDKPENALENVTLMNELDLEKLHPVDQKFVKETRMKNPEAFLARHTWGLPSNEATIPEMLGEVGYSTVMYGKWHLGEHEKHHPTRHGFDYYWGVPQSISVRAPRDNNPWMIENHFYFPNQPMYVNDSIIGWQVDPSLLTKQYTEKAVKYIEDHQNTPFFLYLAYAMPHVPIGASPAFTGKSGMGLYADVIMEIDWSVEKILKALKDNGMDRNTFVFFSSDNGPWLAYDEHAGNAKPLREGKGTLFEGGVRVPAIAWWPGTIPAGSINKNPAMTIDMLPTFAEMAGASLPQNEIDGKSILNMLSDPNTKSPQKAYYFFNMGNFPQYGKLVAIRKDDWKLMLPYTFSSADGRNLGKGGEMVMLGKDSIGLSLFNLRDDVSEQINVTKKYPDKVDELKQLGLSFQKKIESNQRGVDWITTHD